MWCESRRTGSLWESADETRATAISIMVDVRFQHYIRYGAVKVLHAAKVLHVVLLIICSMYRPF